MRSFILSHCTPHAAFRRILLIVNALCVFGTAGALGQVMPATLQVEMAPDLHQQPFTGRIYVFFSDPGRSRDGRPLKRGNEPRLSQDWFHPKPIVAWDVENWQPGTPATINWDDPRLLKFPREIDVARLRGWNAQAMVRLNPDDPDVPNGDRNGYSREVGLFDPTLSFQVDRVVSHPKMVDREYRKVIEHRSPLLSQFHQREVMFQASVFLPAGYFEEPHERYPVIMEIPGFGGSHRVELGDWNRGLSRKRVNFIRVILDPRCPLGHHVFANSANNGPWGDAFITEFLPELDRQFRTIPEAGARFLTGHSSGGWSSLWLMVNYPDHFAGTWSTSPDEVDFRDMQLINIYEDANMYVDENGDRRPLARQGDQVAIYWDDFARMEQVLGPGGQLHSFEAVFSPRGPNGKPLPMWNWDTGEIHRDVAETWKKYDIRLLLEANWPTLGPKLAGKLHVYMGDEDTFYLDGATRLLRDSLEKLGSDAKFTFIPGGDHNIQYQVRSAIEREMSDRFLEFQNATLRNPQ